MNKSKKNVAAPKEVSADTKKGLALPIEITELEELRKLVEAGSGCTPRDVFVSLLEVPSICTPAMLMEMFGLDDGNLKRVFYEYVEGGRDYCASADGRLILTIDYEIGGDGEIIRKHFTPSQEKLRALLVKCINVSRFESFMEELKEEYGIDILYDYYDEVVGDNTITEEDLLDALNTYQAEHQS